MAMEDNDNFIKNTFIVMTIYSILFSFQPCNAQYARWTHARLKDKIINMVGDLVRDVHSKHKMIQYVKRYYDKSPIYHLATMMFNIRVNYKRMKKLYEFASTHLQLIPHEQIKFLAQIHQISMQLDHDVMMLENWHETSGILDDIIRQGKNNMGLRSGDGTSEASLQIKTGKVTTNGEYVGRKNVKWAAQPTVDYRKSRKLSSAVAKSFAHDFENMY